MENAAERGNQLMNGLRELQLSFECIGDVRGKGLMVGMEMVKDRETKERAAQWRDSLIQNAFRKGLLLLGCGENTIRFCPALMVNSEEIEVCLEIVEDCLKTF
jgi:4-aminobutyrate aminotransferase